MIWNPMSLEVDVSIVAVYNSPAPIANTIGEIKRNLGRVTAL